MESLVNFRTRRARLAGRLDVQTQVPDAVPDVFGLSDGGTGTNALVPGAVLYSGNSGSAVTTSARLLFDGTALRTKDLAGNALLTVTTQGNVGIGTSVPQAPLHVYSDVYDANVSARIEGNLTVSGTIVCGTLVQRSDVFSTDARDVRDYLESEAEKARRESSAWYKQSPIRIPWTPAVPAGPDKHAGCVLLPDGRVLFVPGSSGTVVRLFDTRTRTLSSVNANQAGFSGGVLMPNGKVLFVPKENANVGLFDPLTDTFSLGPACQGYSGGVLTRNGKVFLVPSGATSLALFDPATETIENPSPGTTLSSTADKYDGCALLHDGRVLLVPCNATRVGIYDPTTSAWSTPGPQIDGSSKYRGGITLPSGRVAFVPGANARVGLYDPATESFTTSAATVPDQYRGGALLPDGRALFVPYGNLSPVVLYDFVSDQTIEIPIPSTYYGCVLADDGYVYLAPASATSVGIVGRFDRTSMARCLHPMFNKY